MTAIWSTDKHGDWRLLSASGFVNEDELHTLVERAPQLLPLAGAPRLTILGREVRLGSGRADLIAVEPSGRLVIIEVKRRDDAAARRAVVAQALAYAAYLHGLDPEDLDDHVLATHLQQRQHTSVVDAVAADDQDSSLDREAFREGLADSLRSGDFRLVLVLDEAPDELVQVIGYLEAVTDKLTIDLITVSAYDVAGTRLVIPQRVEPERRRTDVAHQPAAVKTHAAQYVAGAQAFREQLTDLPEEQRTHIQRLVAWATDLERQGLARLQTTLGSKHTALRPFIIGEAAGLVTIFKDGSIQLWPTVFARRAPQGLGAVAAALGERKVSDGKYLRDIPEGLLEALAAAYNEAAEGHLTASD